MAFQGELGGFARNPKDVDGDFCAYNYCLAESYLIAMGSEDWDALGDIDTDLVNDVAYWLNYDGKIGENIKNIIEKIPKGLIMTDKDRTFVEAIVAEHKVSLALTFILNGNHDARLYLTSMIYGNGDIVDGNLLNYVHSSPEYCTAKKYTEFLNNIFEEIENHYININNLREQGLFLVRIKPFIQGIRFPKDYKENTELVQLGKFETFGWQKKLNGI